MDVLKHEDSLDVFRVVGEEGLLEFFRECGYEMVRWSRRFGEFLRSWSGFQVLGKVADMMVGCWSVAKRAVGFGAR